MPKHIVAVTESGKKIEIPLPPNCEAKAVQNPSCNEKQSVCCLYNKTQDVCFKIKIEKDGEDLSLGMICPCSKSPNKVIKIVEG